MFRKIIRILLIFLFINSTKNQIDSAPIIGLLLGQNHQLITTVYPNINYSTSHGANDSNNIQPSDYVSDLEFDQVMERLRNQSSTYVSYISDDIPLDELLTILESINQHTSTTLNTLIESEEDVTTINIISDSERPASATTTANPISNYTTSDEVSDRNNIQPSDYVSDSQFDQVMARVRDQSLTYAPDNYISDDVPLDELLIILDSIDKNNRAINIRPDFEGPTPATTNVVQEEQCPICFEPLKSQRQTWTRCVHKFHESCLDKWIRSFHRSTCPVCRSNLNF